MFDLYAVPIVSFIFVVVVLFVVVYIRKLINRQSNEIIELKKENENLKNGIMIASRDRC